MQQPIPETTKHAGKSTELAPAACPKCAHKNAPDARFCSACGIPLSVATCKQCGALNPATAPSCYNCSSALKEAAADASGFASEIADSYTPPPRPPIPVVAWIAGGLILAALFFFGHQAYQMFIYVDIPYEQATLPAGSGDLEKRRGSSYSGTISRPPATDNGVMQGNIDEVVVPTPTPAPLNGKTTTATTRSPVDARSDMQRSPVKAATAAAPAPPIVESKPITRAPKTTGACTAGTWALGLCGAETVQPKE